MILSTLSVLQIPSESLVYLVVTRCSTDLGSMITELIVVCFQVIYFPQIQSQSHLRASTVMARVVSVGQYPTSSEIHYLTLNLRFFHLISFHELHPTFSLCINLPNVHRIPHPLFPPLIPATWLLEPPLTPTHSPPPSKATTHRPPPAPPPPSPGKTVSTSSVTFLPATPPPIHSARPRMRVRRASM